MITKNIAEGIALNFIPDDKYKTNYINLYFAMPLTEKNAAMSNLLARVIMHGSKNYPTMLKLNRALEYNYNTLLEAAAAKLGERQILSVSCSCMKNAFALDDSDIFTTACNLITEAVGNVLLTRNENGETAFREDYLEIERENQKKSIAALINNKYAYARSRCIANMCSGEAFGINSSGTPENVDAVSAKELYDFYLKVMETCPIDIYVVGEADFDKAGETFSQLFEKVSRKVSYPPATIIKRDVDAVRQVKEELDVAQAILMDGFRTGVTFESDNRLAFTLFNAMLGGSVTGKLFMNVREKLSLCYTCASFCDYHKGIMLAYAGINPDMKDKAQEEILNQTDLLVHGKATADDFTAAKNFCVNQIKEIVNNPSLIAWQNYSRKLAGKAYEPLTDIEKINALSFDEVIASGQTIKLDTVYFLAP